jgi:hypothetical protein
MHFGRVAFQGSLSLLRQYTLNNAMFLNLSHPFQAKIAEAFPALYAVCSNSIDATVLSGSTNDSKPPKYSDVSKTSHPGTAHNLHEAYSAFL